jgi:hypothetical protein
VERFQDLFPNDIFRLFAGWQPKKHRLTKLFIVCPFGKLDLSDQRGLNPMAT